MLLSKLKRYLTSFLLVLFVNSCIPEINPIVPIDDFSIQVGNREYELAWADEFDYTGLPDADKWRFETGFVRNDEVQYYTDNRPENVWVEDGRLFITARNDSFGGNPVTSGSIETQDLYEFKYGFVQVRAKMPQLGRGTWPAIWTLGANSDEPGYGWPRCGEIDIVEWTGKAPTVVLGSTFLPDGQGGTTFRSFPYILPYPQVVTESFHNYAVEWDEEKIRYYFDDKVYAVYKRSDLGDISWEPLTKSHYLKLNLAMGGFISPVGGGGPIDYSRFPYTFEIEYARHYVRKD